MKLVAGVFAARVIATMAARGGTDSGDVSEDLGQVSGALSTWQLLAREHVHVR